MIDYPIEYERGRHKYRLIKVYDKYALYINQYGVRECFKTFDLGIKTYNPRAWNYTQTLPIIY